MEAVVKKSPNDKRSYRRLQLLNGLRVILIHDPEISTPSKPTNDNSRPTEQDLMNEDSASDDGSSDSESSQTTRGKKAAAAMVVNIGSFSDPDSLKAKNPMLPLFIPF